MQVFGISDVGMKRALNEDNFSTNTFDGGVIALVCDGMGGANAGEVASRIACRLFIGSILPKIKEIKENVSDRAEMIIKIDRAIYEASELSNGEVYKQSKADPELSGMGTTLSGCIIIDGILWTFNIGDSRVYHVSNDGVEQLTVDHSFVQALLDEGKITADEAQNHPNKNVILRALGTGSNVECDVSHMDIGGGYYLICSDGMSNYFDEKEYKRIITSDRPISEKVEELVSFANSMGGSDNITAVLIDTEK